MARGQTDRKPELHPKIPVPESGSGAVQGARGIPEVGEGAKEERDGRGWRRNAKDPNVRVPGNKRRG